LTTDMSFIRLILDASGVVQAVMLLLVVASIASWALMYAKWRQLRGVRNASSSFEALFWSGGQVSDLYREVKNNEAGPTGSERMFAAGFGEYARLRKQGHDAHHVLDGAQRSMRIALSRETDRLEGSLSFLATVGSVSPYVGLFGTVWGIMNSFRALANVHQPTLGLVAPGIAEALIATALGLFAAIPAVIAYNRFNNELGRLETQFENFIEEFVSLLHRQLHAPSGN